MYENLNSAILAWAVTTVYFSFVICYYLQYHIDKLCLYIKIKAEYQIKVLYLLALFFFKNLNSVEISVTTVFQNNKKICFLLKKLNISESLK